jgi:retron-type reverse transcriptase
MDIPPTDRFVVRLRLTGQARFHFHHGGPLRGLLSAALKRHELPHGLVPFACESGRVAFEPGDPYHLGLTLIGDARRLAEPLVEGLGRLGRERPRGKGPPPTLGGNFEVEEVEALPPVDLDDAAHAMSGHETLSLQFVAPLRLERPEALKVKGAGYLNDDCFPAGHFLDRLRQRLFLLHFGRWPDAEERSELEPPPAEEARARPRGLLWIDVPVPGEGAKARPYTLGGVLGRVELAGVPQDWLPTLAAGALAHAGANTLYGFGRYLVREAQDPAADPFRPARSLLADVADTGRLSRALDHVLELSQAAGSDGVTPKRFDGERDERLFELAAELARGAYEPSTLLGLVVRKDDGGLRPLSIPTVRDRAVQRAAVQVLAPAVDTLLEDCSYAYRKGFSRAGAAAAIQRAWDNGYRWVLDADIRSFFDSVSWQLLFAKLEALYPFEPLVPVIREWVRAPVVFDGRRLERRRGVPQGSPISPVLANLYLDEFDEHLLGRDYRLIRYADDFVVLTRDLERAKEARAAVREENGGPGTEPGAGLWQEEAPRHAWLADVPFGRVGKLIAEGPAAEGRGPGRGRGRGRRLRLERVVGVLS